MKVKIKVSADEMTDSFAEKLNTTLYSCGNDHEVTAWSAFFARLDLDGTISKWSREGDYFVSTFTTNNNRFAEIGKMGKRGFPLYGMRVQVQFVSQKKMGYSEAIDGTNVVFWSMGKHDTGYLRKWASWVAWLHEHTVGSEELTFLEPEDYEKYAQALGERKFGTVVSGAKYNWIFSTKRSGQRQLDKNALAMSLGEVLDLREEHEAGWRETEQDIVREFAEDLEAVKKNAKPEPEPEPVETLSYFARLAREPLAEDSPTGKIAC